MKFPAVLALMLITVPVPVSSQFPGGSLTGADRLRYEFVQRMQIDLSEYLRQWAQGWGEDAERPLRDHYMQNAVIVQSDGRFVRGRTDIRAYADAMVSEGDAATSLLDFEASDGVAYVHGPYTLTHAASGHPEDGQVVSILFRDRNRWNVRAQLFLPAAHTTALTAPVGASHLPPFALPERAAADTRARYGEAMTLLTSLRSAWNDRSTERVAALFSNQPLVLLPGADTPLRGAAVIAALETQLPALGSLTLAVMDFDERARLSYLLGRYHLQGAGGGMTGSFILVTADQGEGSRLRALVFR